MLKQEAIFEIIEYDSLLVQRQKLRSREMMRFVISKVRIRAHIFYIIDSLSIALLHQRGHKPTINFAKHLLNPVGVNHK
jgi:hypothetical protein